MMGSALDEWRRRYEAGETLRDIAADAGRAHTTIHRSLQAAAVNLRPTGQRRGKPWHEEARRLRADGLTLQAIATKLGKSKTRVSLVTREVGRG